MNIKTATRAEFVSHLRGQNQANLAIARHLAKVEAMDDDQFEVHRKSILTMMADPAIAATARKMAASIARKTSR